MHNFYWLSLKNYKKEASILMRRKLRWKCWDALDVLYIRGDLSSKNVDTKDEFLSILQDGKEKFGIRTRDAYVRLRLRVTEFNSPKCRGLSWSIAPLLNCSLLFRQSSRKKRKTRNKPFDAAWCICAILAHVGTNRESIDRTVSTNSRINFNLIHM